MHRLARALLAMLSVALPLGEGAFGAEQTFLSPAINGNPLDWCRTWATDCGQPAADAYCQSRGFERATAFDQATDIGASTPTRLIGNPAQVCSDAMCDGFSFITCFKQQQQQVFQLPMINGNRLDWCLNWAADCGQPAADAFCRSQGFDHSSGFDQAVDIGASSPTRLIGNPAQVCSDAMCDGFAQITCSN